MLKVLPVDSDQHLHIIKEYRKLLETTRGPTGSSKAVVTGGGYLEVTSTSDVLIDRLVFDNPICRYINNLVTSVVDHGLYCGILVSRLLELQWQNKTLSKHKVLYIFNAVTQKIRALLESEKVCIKVDFGSINTILALVQTVISSKHPILLSGLDLSKLCTEIVKVFLNCIDEQTNSISMIYIKVKSGTNSFKSFNGLLYKISESDNTDILKENSVEIKIAVFTLKLEDNSETTSSLVDKAILVLDNMIKAGLQIAACQKTVADEIKLFLRRNRILLLERMGSDFTTKLIKLSRCFPISQLYIDGNEGYKLFGHLSAVQLIEFGESKYVSLHNKNAPIATLLVQSQSLVGEDHVKALLQRAIAALRSVAAHPTLTFGGGCLEAWLIIQLHLLKGTWKKSEYCILCEWWQRAFLSTTCVKMCDSVFHHGWREEGETCMCGVVTEKEVDAAAGRLELLMDVIDGRVTMAPSRYPPTPLSPDALVEPHQQKVNIISAVAEAFTNLSDVGLLVYKDSP